MLKRLTVCFLIISALVVSTPCFAYFESSSWTEETSYNRKMLKKFIFGDMNLSWGWLEIVATPYEAVKQDRMVWPWIAAGICNSVIDTVGGALHLVTFFITPLDIPLPQGGSFITREN
jgi:hypothetical protein